MMCKVQGTIPAKWFAVPSWPQLAPHRLVKNIIFMNKMHLYLRCDLIIFFLCSEECVPLLEKHKCSTFEELAGEKTL